MSGVVAVVPAFREAGRVGPAVHALKLFCDEVIVVDDASPDATAEEAAAAGARVVRLARNAGKGGALAAGIAAAPPRTLVLLLADADLASTAGRLRVLVEAVADGSADLAIAAPPPSRPSGVGLVESLARSGIRALTGVTMARPLSGQRALRASAAASLRLDPRFGVEVGMTIDALRAGLRVVEVPCDFEHARTGRDLEGFSHRAKQGGAVALSLLRRSLRRGSRKGIVRS